MTRAEFGACMAILVAATRPMSEAQTTAYYDLLGDLPPDVLMVACKRSLLESQYPTIPPVGTIRRFAVSVMQGRAVEMTAGEAWSIATKAAGSCDIESPGSVERAFKDVPPLVWKAVETFGFMVLYNLPSNAIETARAQFTRIYDGLLANEERLRLLPASMKEAIAQIGRREQAKSLPAPVAKAIQSIGNVPS